MSRAQVRRAWPLERVIGVLTIVLPAAGTLVAIVLGSIYGFRTADFVLTATMYTITIVAVEVGYHRMIVHRGFKTSAWMRALFASIGSMGTIGPIGWWTANHRRHHAFADSPGDPHSPQPSRASRVERLRSFWHSHAGWLIDESSTKTDPARYAVDVYRDPVLRAVHRLYFPLVGMGILLPAVAGAFVHHSAFGAIRGALWGGFVRMFLVHHAVWALGSFCHTYGSQRYDTGDESRNNVWVAIPTFGEGWHHNHHAFPSSARHGLEWWQIDPNYYFIRALQLLGLAWDVKVPSKRARSVKRRRFIPGDQLAV